jgi:hypothetical protein
MSKYGDLIKKAREPENQIQEPKVTIEPEHSSASEPEVNLCVKVPKSLRQHWAAEAKRNGTTMTSVIVDALNAKFGKPDNQ